MGSISDSIKYTLVDEHDSIHHLGEFAIPTETHQPQEVPKIYTIRRVVAADGSTRLSVVSQLEQAALEPLTDLVKLTVALSLLSLSAIAADVAVLPGGSMLSYEALRRPMKIEPASKIHTTHVMLRPGDVIKIGSQHVLKVEVAVSSSERMETHRQEHVQVGSSIVVEADQLEDSIRSQTPGSRPTVVQETPASARYVDAYSSVGSHVIGNSQALSDVEGSPEPSQELLPDTSLLAQDSNYVDEEKPVDKVRVVIDDSISNRKSITDSVSNERIVDTVSAEPDPAFVTAPSNAPDVREQSEPAEAVVSSKAPPQARRGRKRKSDESSITIQETKKAKRTTSKTKIPMEIDTIQAQTQKKKQEQEQDPETVTSPKRSEKKGKNREITAAVPTSETISKPPRIIFSNSTIPDKPSLMKYLNGRGAKQVDNMSARGFDMLVVGDGELKRTYKLLTAVALGKPVVTDSWIVQSSSSSNGQLLDPSSFVPADQILEDQWPVSLAKIKDRRNLFKGRTILITPALRKEYGSEGLKGVQELGNILGATRVLSTSFRSAGVEKNDPGLLVMAREADDLDVQIWGDHGHTCYTKDLIPISVLLGHVDLNDGRLKIAKTTMTNSGKQKRSKGNKKAS